MDNYQRIRCATENCAGTVQAICEQCKDLYCFNCSLKHAQKTTNHELVEFDTSIFKIQKKCDDLIRKLKIYQAEARVKVQKQLQKEPKNDSKLNPQKFQEQLNYISAMEKETIKIVQKFYSELSLELVNIWETYLNKFSNPESSLQQITDLLQKLEKMKNAKLNQYDKAQFIVNFYDENVDEQSEQCRKALLEGENQSQIPLCPDVQVSEQMLIQVSELLCCEVSTRNYQVPRLRKGPEQKIHINIPDTLDKSVKFMPIFPIRKQYCYLYNMIDNTYQIQEFDKLDFLPAFPKTVMLWNGDIHLIGGANIKDEVLNSHIVFRSSSAEVFKLSNLPVPRNPTNALVTSKKTIYLIGGLNQKKQWDQSCFAYDLQRKQWTEIASMKSSKAHQTICLFGNKIYCFGIPSTSKVNIEEYDTVADRWKDVHIPNFLGNPFNFAASFSAIQINENEILLFGGKKYLENIKNQKRSTDRMVSSHMYIFQPLTNSFVQLGGLNPCIGVRDGEINPIVRNCRVYAAEYLISRNQPICRWLSAVHILEISHSGKAESVMIMHEE